MKKIILLLFSLFLLTGCFNYNELNDLAIISAIGVEKENKNYVVSAQIVNIKKTGSEAGNEGISKVVTYEGKGKDVASALSSIANQASKDIFLPHLKLLLIDDDIIKDNLTDVLDYFARDADSKLTSYVATSTTDKPSEILETLTPLDSLPSQDIYNLLEKSEETVGNANVMTFEELLDILLKEGENPVYTNLKIKGKKSGNENTEDLKESAPKTMVEINNLVTFNNNGNMLELSKNESIGYSFIKNKVKNPTITSKCKNENKYFTIEITSSKAKIKTNLKNKKINILLEATGSVGDINCKNDLSDIKTREEINNITTKKIKKFIEDTALLTIKNKNDFLGFGNSIYKSDKNYFDFKNKDWDKYGIEKFKINTNVKLEIIKEGNLDKNINGSEINEK